MPTDYHRWQKITMNYYTLSVAQCVYWRVDITVRC